MLHKGMEKGAFLFLFSQKSLKKSSIWEGVGGMWGENIGAIGGRTGNGKSNVVIF